DAGAENWHFDGPFRKMTFAARMQHQIYWGPLRRPVEWSLKTVLAPWAYIASVVYHDSFWYPLKAKALMREALASPWGRLFRGWLVETKLTHAGQRQRRRAHVRQQGKRPRPPTARRPNHG